MPVSTTRPRRASRAPAVLASAASAPHAFPETPGGALIDSSLSASGDTPSTPAPADVRSLLRPLGIVGYDAVEPALLAALATEDPLLLVSDHGAAKTLLLVRLAGALG